MAPNENDQFLLNECENIEINENKKTTTNNLSWSLYLSAFTADLLLTSMGTIMVWPSSVIPKLMSNNTDINPLGRPITTLETSFIVSSTPFSVSFGFIIAAMIADIIGRKQSLLYFAMIKFLCLVTIAFTTNIYVYYICFCSIGIVGASVFLTVAVYNTEIGENKNRAWLSCCMCFFIPVGQLYGFVLGAMIDSVKIFTLLLTAPLILHFIFYTFGVESPIYLIMKNKTSKALSCLKKLRTYDNFTDIEKEYKSMKECSTKHVSKNAKFPTLFKTNRSRKALFLSFLLICCQQISGINIIFAYLGLMFKEAGTILNGNELGVIVGFVNLTSILIIIFVINKFGRRPLLLISSLFCSISLSSIAFYFFMKETHSSIVEYIRWQPVFSVILFILFHGLGLGTIPMGYIGELFPNELRSIGVAIASILSGIICSVSDFGFPLLSEALGISFSLFLYSVLLFFGFVAQYFCLPETRGKSFEEIQKMLDANKLILP